MKKIFFFLPLIILFLPGIAQEQKPVNQTGLIVEYGIGSSAITDEYISNERYTGTMPYIGFWYGRMKPTRGYQLGLTYQDGDDFENYSIRAEFSRVSLNFDQYYRMDQFQLFGKEAAWYFGPSVEYFEYELINRFSSNHKSFSELIMVSMGINALLEWKFAKNFTAAVFLRSNVIGVNHKLHDESKYPDENSKLQTLFTANNLNGDLYVRYQPLRRLSIGLKGKAQYTRSTGWDKSISFTNSILLFAIVHF